MQEIRKEQFLGWIKIRIGQPLTALEIDDLNVIFGSISGYIGSYDLQVKKVYYYEPICQEIIRGIYSKNDGKFYVAVGDKRVAIKDKIHKQHQQNFNIARSHSHAVCSHSMTMMSDLKQVIFCAFPTQKRQPLSTELEVQKNKLYEVDFGKIEAKIHRQFKMPEVAVPFDFDGDRILWMEYQPNQVKQFQYYDLHTKQNVIVHNFGKAYHFISYGRLIGKLCAFVQNNKNVKCLNTADNTIVDLYSHQSSIIAFHVEKRHQPNYSLISVDFNGTFIEWKNGNIVRQFDLWKSKNIPQQISKHKYLFDMGYAYYVRAVSNIVAITTDLGLIMFKV